MVTPFTETRNYPAYDLTQVIALAKAGSVGYRSSSVVKDRDNLNYSHQDVCDCLAMLTDKEFDRSGRYEGIPGWCDVYKLSVTGPTKHDDDLYIKFRLARGCLTVTLWSFHVEGQM